METQERNERTLEELFESTEEDIVEPYEVVRTIGFTLKCKSGDREYRLEAIKRPGQEPYEVLVWERDGNGWKEGFGSNEGSLHRIHPDLALRSMVTFIAQHMTYY